MADWKDYEYETVTLVVGYKPGQHRRPEEWDWQRLINVPATDPRVRSGVEPDLPCVVIEAWTTENDELEKSGIVVPTCDLCGEPQDTSAFGFAVSPDWNDETGNHRTCESEAASERAGL